MGTGRGPETWPSARDGASAFAETVAVRVVTGERRGRWRPGGADSGAAAAAPRAAEKKSNTGLFRSTRREPSDLCSSSPM